MQDNYVPADLTLYREKLEAMRRSIDGQDLKHPVESRLCQGEAEDEIIRAAAELGNGLIVMGNSGELIPLRLRMRAEYYRRGRVARKQAVTLPQSSHKSAPKVDHPSECVAVAH